jgi:hypothetical protein
MTNVEGRKPEGAPVRIKRWAQLQIDHPLTGLYRAFSGEQFEGPVD